MTKRVAIPKKMRFEVLKRDAFACQYCGGKAPDVLLQIDHVVPVVDGGPTTIMNLVTSCEPCNNGKGGTPLSNDMALSKATKQAAELQARREQIEMMAEWQNSLVDLDAFATDQAVQLAVRLTRWGLTDDGRKRVHAEVKKHGLETVMGEMRAAAAKTIEVVDGAVTRENAEAFWETYRRSVKYAAYRKKDPVGSDLRYMRGIVRKRVGDNRHYDDDECLALLTDAHAAGVSLDELRRRATTANHWAEWADTLVDRMNALGGAKR